MNPSFLHLKFVQVVALLLLSSLSLGAFAQLNIPLSKGLSNLAGSTLDVAIMSTLLGATLMLVIINIGQGLIRHERLNIFLALYTASISAAMAHGWNANQPDPLLTIDIINRKSLTLLTLCLQVFFVLQYFPLRATQKVWRIFFIGLHLILFTLGLWLLNIHNDNAHRAMRLLFLLSGGLCIGQMLMMYSQRIPFTKHLVLAKAICVGLALTGWLFLHNFGLERPLFFWFGQSLVIIESMVVTYALVMLNITQTGERLQTHYERGLKLKLKRQYNQTLKRVDHELRTPLSGIVGIAELLLDTSLNKTQRDQILTMRRASESQLKWLNRLNDWRSLQIGRLTFDAIPFDFSHLLDTLCEDSKVKADDRKISFQYHKNPQSPTLIKGDPARIKQIISGTLEMALFYSEQGNISVHLKASSQRNLWRLEIRDSQSGLHPEDIHMSLDNDTDIDAQRYSSIQRNWVIAHALAEHIGGRLSVEMGQGQNEGEALFVCELILTRYSLLQHHENHYDKLLQNKRLLVVDDSSSSRKVVAKRADSWGMKVTCVPSAKDALAMMKTMSNIGGTFDVIILDHDMPDMTGFELAQEISQNHADLKPSTVLPVMIMLSGASEPPSQEQARSASIRRVLTKPISAKSLKITLAEELTLHNSRHKERSGRNVEMI
ncbi:MAG: response regulator [Cellvibrionaceae bacterium]